MARTLAPPDATLAPVRGPAPLRWWLGDTPDLAARWFLYFLHDRLWRRRLDRDRDAAVVRGGRLRSLCLVILPLAAK